MSDAAQTVHQLIQLHRDAVIRDWRGRLDAADMGSEAELRQEMSDLVDSLASLLGARDDAEQAQRAKALDQMLAEASQLRVLRGQSPESSVRFLHALKDALLGQLMQLGQTDVARGDPAALLVQSLVDRCVVALVSQFVSARENVIRSQAQSLLDMSTPVISLWESILLLPLVGVIDSVRAVQIAERLLESIGQTEAEVTLIDVTGVPVMDSSVARHLLRTVAAAEMLGTRVVLTGISPSTAQTMVKLGIDMSSVPTRGSLKAGVALALRMTGREIRAAQEA